MKNSPRPKVCRCPHTFGHIVDMLALYCNIKLEASWSSSIFYVHIWSNWWQCQAVSDDLLLWTERLWRAAQVDARVVLLFELICYAVRVGNTSKWHFLKIIDYKGFNILTTSGSSSCGFVPKTLSPWSDWLCSWLIISLATPVAISFWSQRTNTHTKGADG